MAQDVTSTTKSMVDSGVDVVGVAAINILVTLNWVDSSRLFSDTTLEWILGMAMVYVVVVEGLDRSGFFGLFFGILNFFTVFQLLNVSITAIALARSFAFKKKATKLEWLLLQEGSSIHRVVFVWGVCRLVNFQFQSNTLFKHLLPICGISVQTKHIHTWSKKITFTCLNKTCK